MNSFHEHCPLCNHLLSNSPVMSKHVLKAGKILLKFEFSIEGIFYIHRGKIQLIFKDEDGFLGSIVKTSGDIFGRESEDSKSFPFDILVIEETEISFLQEFH